MRTSRSATIFMMLAGIASCAAHGRAPAQSLPTQDPRSFFPQETIQGADQVDRLKREAEEAMLKTAASFTDGCPSQAAQQLYDGLKSNLATLQQIRSDAQRLNDQAAQGLAQCLRQQAALAATCQNAYRALPYATTKQAAEVALAATNKALLQLRSLQCVARCNKTARLLYPEISFTTGNGPVVVPNPSTGQVEVCTQWDKGAFAANFDPGDGQLIAQVRSKLPRCPQKETIYTCTEWDVNAVVAKLREQASIPAAATDFRLSVPTRSLEIISGLQGDDITRPVRICAQPPGNAMLTANLADNPLSVLSLSGCGQTTRIAYDPFLIGPRKTTIEVHRLTDATLSYQAAPSITVGSNPPSAGLAIAIMFLDLTKPEFRSACNTARDLVVTGPSRVTVTTKALDLPYVCLEPVMAGVVRNP